MPRTDDSEAVRQGRGREWATRDRNERGVLLGTIWGAILLLLLAGFYVAVERGEGRMDRILRWMHRP